MISFARDDAKVSVRHVISVDVEDYFQVEAFADSVPRESWDRWPSRVVSNTRRVLELFDRHKTKGTFFFVGWVAKRFPELVREVYSRGHELACHSFWHRPIYSLSPDDFREDTRIARDVIEQASGARLLGYRAPTWSITEKCLWALDILAEQGFVYDSSIYPISHDLYGIPNASRFAYVHRCSNGDRLREFPPATVRFAGLNLPGAGGGYLRILPFWYTEWMFRRFEAKYCEPVVVYFHPWELDPEQPRISDKIRSRLRHYTNIGHMQDRLHRLLRRRTFQPFREMLATFTKSTHPDVAGVSNQGFAENPVALSEYEFGSQAPHAVAGRQFAQETPSSKNLLTNVPNLS